MNSSPNKDMLSMGVLASQGKSYGLLAQWILVGSALGYMADTLIRSANGKAAKDPRSPDTWIDAMAKSGSGGLYVDFFAGEWDKYDFGASLLGPTLGNAGQAAKAVAYAKEGKGPQSGKIVTRMLRSYVPFQQAVGAKQVLDYAQYGLVNEALDPGSYERYKIKQMQKEARGQ